MTAGGRVRGMALRFVGTVESAGLPLEPHVEGLPNVPRQGPAIICCNHRSRNDHIQLAVAVRRRVRTARSEDQVRRLLAKGELLVLFPEGPPSPDGRLYRGRPRVGRIALAAGVTVIPAAFVDSEPGGDGRRILRFGEPLDFSRFRALGVSDGLLRSISDEVTWSILTLSGQSYVDSDATDAQASRRAASREAARQAREQAATVRRERREVAERARAATAAESDELALAAQNAAELARDRARRASEADAAARHTPRP